MLPVKVTSSHVGLDAVRVAVTAAATALNITSRSMGRRGVIVGPYTIFNVRPTISHS